MQQIVYNPKPMMEEDSWYILFDVLPKAMEISRPLPGVYEICLRLLISAVKYSILIGLLLHLVVRYIILTIVQLKQLHCKK